MFRSRSKEQMQWAHNDTFRELCDERKKTATLTAEVQRLQEELAKAQHDADHFESAELPRRVTYEANSAICVKGEHHEWIRERLETLRHEQTPA